LNEKDAELHSGASGDVRGGPIGERALCGGASCGGEESAGIGAESRWRRLYVANRLDDSISVLSTRENRVIQTIRLAGPEKVSALRRGEQTFYHAYAFQGSLAARIATSTRHLTDCSGIWSRMVWESIVDNRLIEDLRGTEPFKWNGGNPTLVKECGIRTETYFWRSQNFDDLRLTDLVVYVRSCLRGPIDSARPTAS